MQLQNSRKALWHFYFLFSHLLPSAAAVLIHIPSVGPWCLVPEKKEKTLFVNYWVYLF